MEYGSFLHLVHLKDTRIHATPVSMKVTLLARLKLEIPKDIPEYISYHLSLLQL